MPTINRTPIRPKRIKYQHENQSAEYYNSKAWKKLRHSYIIDHPLCECCLKKGKVTTATEIHHCTPFLTGKSDEQRWTLLLNTDNLMSVCSQCHDELHRELKRIASN